VTDDPQVRTTGSGHSPGPGFWLSQRGPHPESAVEDEDRRCIGEIVCPGRECNKVLARLYDSAGGIDVRAWAPATPIPGSPQHGPLGWTMCAVIGEDVPDVATERLHCWREHLDLELSAGLCREVAEVYRSRGSKVRRPAAAYTQGDN
jgi:hypothetical protein